MVGGYWRRHIVRLALDPVSSVWRVDPCWDPSLGLGNFPPVPVLGLALQPEGCVLVAGDFLGVDGHNQNNITRLLPQSDCAALRLLIQPRGEYVAATFPAGGTNVLERSMTLSDWTEVSRTTDPYIFYSEVLGSQAFFRAKQER